MYITFQCDPCAGVPQDLRKTADLKSGLHTPCRKTMPQSMEMNIFQITIFRILPHAILQSSGFQEIPCFSGQNICFQIICSPFVTELFNILVHGDHPYRPSTFRNPGYDPGPFFTCRIEIFQTLHGMTYKDDFIFQRNIFPFQSTYFSDAQSCQQCQQNPKFTRIHVL